MNARSSLVPESWTPRFAALVRERFGHDVPERRLPQFRRAVLEACLACGESSLERYLGRLAGEALDSAAVMELLARFTIKESYFFRDESMIALLRDHFLPELCARRPSAAPISIWSAGCSVGEEPYTLSILMHELTAERPETRFTIVGSDVDEHGLQRARVGEFSEWSVRTLNEEQRERYFERRGSRFALRGRYKNGVRFEHHNLVDVDCELPAPRKFDVILCRNVAIYFTEEGISALYTKLCGALAEDGMLLVAPSDPRPPQSTPLEAVIMRRGRRACLGYVRTAGVLVHERPTPPTVRRILPSTLPPPSSEAPIVEVEEASTSVAIEVRTEARSNAPAATQIELDAESYYHASMLELERDDYVAAEVSLRRTLYLAPEHAEAHYRLGLLCARRGEAAAARRSYFNALELVRKRGAAGLGLAALIGAQLGKLDKTPR